jgi:AcrR family transcriptional regulator
VIDEDRADGAHPPRTRAAQRERTREAIVAATAGVLVDDGYADLTTRRVAQRAGVAQSTVMHHFPTREELLVAAVELLALRLAAQAFERLDLTGLRTPALRSSVLDEVWREFTSPESLAVAQMWAAVWAEPELVPTLRELESRITGLLLQNAVVLFPEWRDDPRLPAAIDASIALVRGLTSAVPIWGADALAGRFEQIKPIMLQAAAAILDDPA